MMTAFDFTIIRQGWLKGFLSRSCYELRTPLEVKSCVYGYRVSTDSIDLYKDGTLVLHFRFRWNGASGPTFDTFKTMRASAVHDALYRLLQKRLIDEKVRWQADLMLYRIMREDGASAVRAFYWLVAVEIFGRYSL